MEKNKQVVEFGNIIKDIDSGLVIHYNLLRNLFLDYIEYLGMPWEEYTKKKTRKEIIDDFKYFNLYYYLPF